jgi:iron-sulfur cluster repair protein YtfE (RIC family)
VHRAISADLARLTTLAEQVAGGERTMSTAGARRLGRYAHDLFACIDAHLDDEDEIVWPVVVAAAGPAVDVGPLADDHHALDPLIARAVTAIDAWGAAPADPHRAAVASTVLRELSELIDEHIADEEREVFPILAQYVRAEDYDRCEQRIRLTTAASLARFLVPWVIAVATPPERATALRRGGWRVRLTLALWERRYAARAAAVFG